MVDFIDMAKRKHRRAVEAAFLEAAEHDRAQVTFLPISPLGVMEVARERLQGNHAGRHVVADEKVIVLRPSRHEAPQAGPRRVRGPRPPPWARGRDASGSAGSDATAAAPKSARTRRTGKRDSSRTCMRTLRSAVANHSGSFYGGARRGRGRGKTRGGQKHAGSGDGS